jgi:hypothetical protein
VFVRVELQTASRKVIDECQGLEKRVEQLEEKIEKRPTQELLTETLLSFSTKHDYKELQTQLQTYVPIARFVTYQNEVEEKLNEADEFLIHNYYNKTSLEGLLKSLEEQFT